MKVKTTDSYDVVIVGAGLAGCTAATLLGRAGARVALVERRPDRHAHKVVCTHGIVSCATPTIERLGLARPLEKRGAIRIHGDAWTRYGGWIVAPDDTPRGFGVTRRTLDPMVRDLAAGTPGVELMTGRTVTALVCDGSRAAGVVTEDRDHGRRTVRARLVVGADGRASTVARLAGVRGRVRAHDRFFYFAYWRGLPHGGRARVWLMEPDGGAALPCEDGLTVVGLAVHKSNLPAFRADREGSYRRFVGAWPDGPDLDAAERASELIGKLDTPNVSRPAAVPGLAFAGDAAVATDPVFGVGCAWAFQSGDWLADMTSRSLLENDDDAIDRALRRYRRRVSTRLGMHHFFIADQSAGRPMNPPERMIFRAAASGDLVVRHAVDGVASRRRSPLLMLHPRVVAHAVRYGLASATG